MSDEAKVLQIAGFLRIVGEGLLSGDALRTEARELEDVAGSLLESRWIPVSDPPEHGTRVLVRCVDDSFHDCEYLPKSTLAAEMGTPWIGRYRSPLVATHWTVLPQLPEPPKP